MKLSKNTFKIACALTVCTAGWSVFATPAALAASTTTNASANASVNSSTSSSDSTSSTGKQATAKSSKNTQPLGPLADNLAPMSVDNAYPQIGDTVTVSASKLTPNATYQLVWETVKGSWETQAEHFIGANYTLGSTVLSTVQADNNGDVNTSFKVPVGFGDLHLIGLRDALGTVVAESGVTVPAKASIDKTTTPEGTFFHLTIEGLGYGHYTSQYTALWDNRVTGNVSAVTTDGTAKFTIRAEGEGAHTITLEGSSVLGAYLNEQQSPYSWKPVFNFNVTVTKGTPKTVQDALPKPTDSVGDGLTASPGQGVVGDTFTLSGTKLEPNHSYQIGWITESGNRVSGGGYGQTTLSLGQVKTDASGDFSTKVKVPDDLGGPAHLIEILDGDKVVATTHFRVYPKLVSVPKTVKQGQVIDIHLQGVGWTEYDNVYSVDYDNGWRGYACGFNTHGDIDIRLRATGAPGIHYIDLYPTIYKGKQTLPNIYVIPQLTYAADHPVDDLPAFHIAIDVTK